MSAHHLTIAKASFAAGLLRPDITKVGRNDLATFHTLFEAAITICTARNIEKCKAWIATNIAPSAARTAALGKYLASFARHVRQEKKTKDTERSLTASRKKLHIIYVLHDVVHHAKYHNSDLSGFSTFTASLQPYLIELIQASAAGQRPRIISRLSELFNIWDTEKIYSKDYVNKLRQAIAESSVPEPDADGNLATSTASHAQKNEPVYIMPASHGDPSTPYYDLPAGNLLPFLDPSSSAPIRPEQIKPLQFTAGPADKPLVKALKDFLKDIESIERRYAVADDDIGLIEVDELGQITIRDEAGDITGDTYYGWSRAFCEKMKRRKKGLSISEHRRRSLSRSSSRSLSRTPRKRRRFSDSDRSRSLSYSRSRSPPRFRAASPPTNFNEQRTAQAPRSFADGSQSQAPPSRATPNNLPPAPPPFPAPPLGPNGLPIPPPRPPNWHGPWPPPQPYMVAGGNVAFPPQYGSNFPPPPPPGYPYGSNYR